MSYYSNKLRIEFSNEKLARVWHKEISSWSSCFNESIIIPNNYSEKHKCWGVSEEVSIDNMSLINNSVTLSFKTFKDINIPVLNQLLLDIRNDDERASIKNLFICTDLNNRGIYNNSKVLTADVSYLYRSHMACNGLYKGKVYYARKHVSGSNVYFNFLYNSNKHRVKQDYSNCISDYNYNFSNKMDGIEHICSSNDFEDLKIIEYKDKFYLFEKNIISSIKEDIMDDFCGYLDIFL